MYYIWCDLGLEILVGVHKLTVIYKPGHAQAVKLLVKELYALQHIETMSFTIPYLSTDNYYMHIQ